MKRRHNKGTTQWCEKNKEMKEASTNNSVLGAPGHVLSHSIKHGVCHQLLDQLAAAPVEHRSNLFLCSVAHGRSFPWLCVCVFCVVRDVQQQRQKRSEKVWTQHKTHNHSLTRKHAHTKKRRKEMKKKKEGN